MLTKEDLKKIEELLQPKFDHLELRLDEHDRRFDAIEKKLEEYDKRFEAIDKRFEAIDKRFEAIDKRFEAIDKRFEAIDRRFGVIDKKLGEHDSKFDLISNSLIDIDRRIENLVEVVGTHTDMLKDINIRVIAIERHMKSNMQYIQNLDSDIGQHGERLHKLEEITGILNTLRDKGKDRYKYVKP